MDGAVLKSQDVIMSPSFEYPQCPPFFWALLAVSQPSSRDAALREKHLTLKTKTALGIPFQRDPQAGSILLKYSKFTIFVKTSRNQES
jgi:hypothetical protein